MISVFTPSHDPRFLDDCLDSLQRQTEHDWEWVVVLNGGARWQPESPDTRVRVIVMDQLRGVGACKSFACQQARGDILVEFDHDDYLLPGALASVAEAFAEAPGASLVYSDFAQVDANLQMEDGVPFGQWAGWEYETIEVPVKGETIKVLRVLSMQPTPHNASLIWYQPNHVRAFARWAYEGVGGYDWSLDYLDDQDLMNRLYRVGEFVCIDKCLYLQRNHGANTQRREQINAAIQRDTLFLYERDIQANALAWAQREGLECVDLGAATGKPDGYLGIDLTEADGVDVVGDVFDWMASQDDDSVGVIRAVDFLEHIGPEPSKRIRLFNEFHRLLAHGGMLLSLTPSTDSINGQGGRGAFQDPTHVSFYNENSFWYFTQQQHAQYVPEITCRFQASRIMTTFPTEWHQQHGITYVQANLIALKPGGSRQGGQLLWPE